MTLMLAKGRGALGACDHGTWTGRRGIGAFRAEGTTGIAAGTWLLILGELLCWGVFGVHESDPRLIVLGATGVTASLLVLARVARPRGPRTLRPSDGGAVTTAEVRA